MNSLVKYRKAAGTHKRNFSPFLFLSSASSFSSFVLIFRSYIFMLEDISLAQKIFAFSWAIYPSYLTEENAVQKKTDRHLPPLFESLQVKKKKNNKNNKKE